MDFIAPQPQRVQVRPTNYMAALGSQDATVHQAVPGDLGWILHEKRTHPHSFHQAEPSGQRFALCLSELLLGTKVAPICQQSETRRLEEKCLGKKKIMTAIPN